ncbi:hypothetical protein [Ruegeria faecimaris]|uniref:hypothetical protein n=1 Tax=Ruegeria faecimaris TaxID=686389 RepID=UPI0024924441|nr:hypothetical protein [Ruegeria faecimaris]
MNTGVNGRVAISWSQTEIDGLEAAPLAFLNVGSAWSWRGQASMLAGSAEVVGRKNAFASGTIGRVISATTFSDNVVGTLELMNGAQRFSALLVVSDDDESPSLVFESGCPSRDQEFWISAYTQIKHQSGEVAEQDGTVVAFHRKATQFQYTGVANLRATVNGATIAD